MERTGFKMYDVRGERDFLSVLLYFPKTLLRGLSRDPDFIVNYFLADSCFSEYITILGLGHRADPLRLGHTNPHRIRSKVTCSDLFLLLQIKKREPARCRLFVAHLIS